MHFVELTERRLDSAYTALKRCEESKSEWGINYWQRVIAALMRQLNHYISNPDVCLEKKQKLH